MFLEIVINLTVIAEVSIRLIALKSYYFASLSNILDLFVVLFCFLAMYHLFSRECSLSSELEQSADNMLILFRYLIGLFRLFYILKNNHKTIPIIQPIDFVDLEMADVQ